MVIPVAIDDAMRLVDWQLRGIEAALANLLKLLDSVQERIRRFCEDRHFSVCRPIGKEDVEEVRRLPRWVKRIIGIELAMHGRVEGHTETAKAVLRYNVKGLSRMVISCVHGHYSY
jgi:hypothetical protein